MATTTSTVGNITDTNATVSSAASTTTSPTTSSTYRFPSDIDVIDHLLDITIFEYSRANRMANATRKGIKGHITLPLPPRLSTAYSAEYDNAAMGIAEHLGIQVAKVSKDISSVSDKIANLDFSGVTKGAITASGLAAGYALDHALGSEGAQLEYGMTRNPHFAVLYKGPKFRVHDFSWTFYPRNQQESQTLQNIIYLLKYSQAPDISESFSNHLFKYPDEMEIKFHYPDYLFSIGPSVLTSIAIDYHGDQPAYFQTSHAPVQIKIDLSFQETSILTKQSISNDRR